MSRIFAQFPPLSFLARPKGTASLIPNPPAMDLVEVAETTDTLRVRSHVQYNTPDHITPTNVHRSPLEQFHIWFNEARITGVREPEAMSLSTATASGIPSSRMVLFKQLDKHGFVFYTNYTSRKSKELEENPNAALLFFWREMSRQVRIVGRAEKVSKEENEAYFKSRPVGSQVGAWASKQSSVIEEDILANRLKKFHGRFGVTEDANEGDVPAPEFWGGWRVIPDEMEFWLGKPSRLHDRIRYVRVNGSASDEEPQWKVDRLSP
ncbi:pyridoxamine 5'-phosphate oxidase [Pisolithus croceorrhizus]|nr:pyridoxamine 5'-phosphate oxidase [Pisolithus croceorrhizus]